MKSIKDTGVTESVTNVTRRINDMNDELEMLNKLYVMSQCTDELMEQLRVVKSMIHATIQVVIHKRREKERNEL